MSPSRGRGEGEGWEGGKFVIMGWKDGDDDVVLFDHL